MNQKQLQKNKLVFTGVYDKLEENVNMRLDDYKGYKTSIVRTDRFFGGDDSIGDSDLGYALYVEKKFFVDGSIKTLQYNLDVIREKRYSDLKAEYERKLKNLKNLEASTVEKIKKYQEELKSL